MSETVLVLHLRTKLFFKNTTNPRN